MPESTSEFRAKKIVIWALVGIGLCGVVGAAYYFYIHWSGGPEYSQERSVFSVLIDSNPSFAEGVRLTRARDFQAAHPQFEAALLEATDDYQRSYVEYWIADTNESLRNFSEAIQGYKKVVATSPHTLLKAYAALRIPLIVDWYAFAQYRDVVIAEAFAGEPYASFYEGDLKLATRKLYEYAASIYPLAIAEARSADWYAEEILRLLEEGESGASIEGLYALVKEKVDRAKTDMQTLEQYENAVYFLPIALQAMGKVVAELAAAGQYAASPIAEQVTADGMTLAAAEEMYKEALELRALWGGRDSYERFYYAAFLEQYFEDRDDEIKEVLANYYELPIYQISPAMGMFSTLRGSDNWKADAAVRLGKVDPQFKELLISLGWTAEDFI